MGEWYDLKAAGTVISDSTLLQIYRDYVVGKLDETDRAMLADLLVERGYDYDAELVRAGTVDVFSDLFSLTNS